MIRYLVHSEIDKEKWDTCIHNSLNGLVYACSWFLDIVSPGWNALVSGDYSAVFPLTQRKKWGQSYLFQPAFTQQLGVFSPEPIHEKLFNEFLSAIPDQFKLVEIQMNWKNNFAVSTPGVRSDHRVTHHLSLQQDEGKIFSGYSENMKRNVKKAERSDLELFKNPDVGELVKLFMRNRGKSISNLKKTDYNILNNLCSEARSRGLLEVSGCRSAQGQMHAGAIFLRSFHEYIFLFSATDETGRNSGAMSGIMNSFIREHSGENMNLDFEGSMDPSLARFYKGFGSQEIVYLQIRKNELPGIVRWLKK